VTPERNAMILGSVTIRLVEWGLGKRRWALAALLICSALLVSAPAAFAIEAPGSISGTVTDASHKPLANIEVTAYQASGKESFVGFATTKANGEYTVENLPKGEYTVEFAPEFESGLNYVPQFYNDKASFATADRVLVVEGKSTENIDAELEAGGKIEGTVTDVSTHVDLSNVIVIATGSGEAAGGLAFTNASGQYTMSGLAPGSYEVEFIGPGYITQYYNDQPSFASANPVVVARESTALGINAALVPAIAPINTTAPVASGTPVVGQTLSCTTGSWKGSPAPTFVYSWLRDGVAIPGASGSMYVVQAADQGNGVTCRVTATNKFGRVSAVSNTLIVPVPSPPPPTPVIMLLSSKIAVSGSSANVPISCTSATCAGTIELTEQVVVKRRHHHKTVRTVVLGRGAYALAAGHSTTVAVHLTSIGKNTLAKAKHHRVSASARVSVIGGATVIGSVVLSEPAPKHKHGRR
jgi:hypothetical protein